MMGVSGWLVCAYAVLCAATVAAAPSSWRQTRGDKEWCDPALGCLTVTDEWFNLLLRPLNPLPNTRKSINTRFMLHTRTNRAANGEDVFVVAKDASTIAGSTFDPTKPIKFIIHGFIDSGNTYWLKDMAEAFLDHGDYNVFRVNWAGGSRTLLSIAAANARVVGLEIGYLVNWLVEEYGVNAGDVHLIGHSLGAHVSGYAGEQIKGMGRISGLDPAGPYYEGMPIFVRLDDTDALFVDNIHTDADALTFLGFGTDQPMGHLDFFPNSGHDQPGCDPLNIIADLVTEHDIEAIRDIAVCSHTRAIFLFLESLRARECRFLAHECSDYNTFVNGMCNTCGEDNTRCAYPGIRADEYLAKQRTNILMYFDTDKEEPFCYQHYALAILTTHPYNAEDWIIGHITASFYGDNGNVIREEKITGEHMRITLGGVTTIMLKSHIYLSTIMRADFRWDYDDEALSPGTYCVSPFCDRNLYVKSIQISPINFYPESRRLRHTHTFCVHGGGEFVIKDGKMVSLTYMDECQPVISNLGFH